MKLAKIILTSLLLVNTLIISPVSAEEVLNNEEEVVLEEVNQEGFETTEAQEEIIVPEEEINEEEVEAIPTEEPVIEVTPEPTPEITPEPTVEPTPEVTPEPTVEPTPESTPEVTVEKLEEINEEEAAEEVVEEEPIVLADENAVESIKLDKSTITVNVNNSVKLNATVQPTHATNNEVTWTSSNTNVAKVDSNGKVTAVNGGTATITVTTQDGKKTAKSTVTVNMPKVQAVAVFNSAHGADIRWKPITGVRYYGIWRKRTNPITKVLEEKIVQLIDTNTYTTKEGGYYKWTDPYLKDKYTDKGKEWEGGWVYYVTARSTSNINPSYQDGSHLTIDGPISNKLNLYRLRNPELKSVTSNGDGKVTVTWSNVPPAHAYEVQYKLQDETTWTKVPEVVAAYWNENGKEIKVSGYKPSVTISGLPMNKKINFRIRCRKTNTNLGVTWSEYSPWMNHTLKKNTTPTKIITPVVSTPTPQPTKTITPTVTTPTPEPYVPSTVYWTPNGKSYHYSRNCLSRSKTVYSGSLEEAFRAGKKDPCNKCAGGH